MAASRRSSRPSPRWGITSKPGREPRTRLAVEHQHAPARRGRPHRGQRVGEGRRRQRRRLLGRARWGAARLRAARGRRLGQHDEVDGPGAHEARTRRMSRTACTVPRTVPVTFERPMRGA